MGLGSYLGKHESGTNPDSTGTERESSSESLVVEDTACSNNLHWLSSHGRLAVLAETDDLWDQDGCRDVTGVASSFTTLGADHVDAEVEALLDVLGVADHVHVEDAGFVELVDDLLGGHADGGDEEAGAGVDDDVGELAELALGVVVAVGRVVSEECHVACLCMCRNCPYLVFRALPPTCGRRRSTPNGAFLSLRKPLSSAICSRSMSGV